MSAFQGILRHLCPRCRKGPIFRGWLAVHEACPFCGLQFNRGEQGYFIGAMYVSYALSIPPVLALVAVFWRLLHWSFGASVIGAFLAYLPVVPFTVRLSRVIWIYVDRTFDPH